RAARFLQEIFRRFRQPRQFLRPHLLVTDWPRVRQQTAQTCLINPPSLGEPLQADQQRIARKCGDRGIGGVSVSHWTERQNLPKTLAGRSQKIHELVCGRAEISNASRRRKRGGMQKDSGDSRKRHVAWFSVVS